MRSEKPSKDLEMSEATQALLFCEDIAFPSRLGGASRKMQITSVYRTMTRRYPSSNWNWRRVKALMYGEVTEDNVGARELRELQETAAIVRAARKAHAEFIAETERLAAVAAHSDEDFLSGEIAARRGVALGMGLPRIGGDRK